ncbi:hypothetical protein [Bradyrhizobium commune]|uniref:Uncharacterized protein n=1 Tax=Bradyrhizobium commune TaxID=83627 RepID=A0A7S9D4P6_9BRAD|nr:hypothetical protein [Bradyrhizobium commune]QPF91130.1 hypothetical protein IC761_32495 [Bradyrhizobium commune]
MIDTLLSGPEQLALFRFWRRGARFEGLIRSFIRDFGGAWAGSGRVCFKTGAARHAESDD